MSNPPPHRWNILIVEDETDIAQLVALHLQDINAQTQLTDRGDTALELAQSANWDLIILDLRLPGMGGLEVCRRIRENGRQTPVLMLTSKSTELDRVLGLELGADDYVTKPFSPLELVARVKAILRRVSIMQQSGNDKDIDNDNDAKTGSEPVRCGAMVVDARRREVTVHDCLVELTSREFDLLEYFVRHPGQVFRRSELLDKVWGYGHEGYEHTVNSHINRLRAKIEPDPANPEHILTVWGVGYKFSEHQAA
ncbi:MAG: response regulator transcription factor [Halioglobus sp.]